MAVKTITVTEEAYSAVAKMKTKNESFTDLFLRISRKKPLSSFYGTMSKEASDDLRKCIRESKELRRPLDEARQKKLIAAFSR